MTRRAESPLSELPAATARRVDALLRRGSQRNRRGDVDGAVRDYRTAIRLAPAYGPAHYDLGLVYKYARRWKASLRANLEALRLDPGNEGAIWNAGIAATALGDWKVARAMWKRYGIELPGRGGEIRGRFGSAVVRLNPEGGGETVWVQRLCPARARLMNVPLPRSGFRCGDVVLNDGARQGSRTSNGRDYPVFNALARLQRSALRTYSVELEAPAESDVRALEEQAEARSLRAEDWSSSMQALCLRCSYGVPHRHRRKRTKEPAAWSSTRSVGIAARSRADAVALLGDWAAAGAGRKVTDVFGREPRREPVRPRHAWWDYDEFKDHG